MQGLAARCGEVLGADLCQIFLSDEDLLVLRAEAPPDPRTTVTGPATLAPRQGFAARVLATRLALRLDPASELLGTEAIWRGRGMRQIAGVTVSPVT